MAEDRDSVLKQTSALTYEERINYASKLGKQIKDAAKVSKLIDDLRKHPEPETPEVEVEEGFTELLPPQKYNVSKYYDEDRLAIALAVSCKNQKQKLLDELNSPSKMFKKLVSKAVVNQVSDDELEKEILKAPSRVRKMLLNNAIKNRKTSLLDKLLPILQSQKGIDSAQKIVHGCSSGVVKAFLEIPLNIKSPLLNWKHITLWHPDVVLTLIHDSFKDVPPKERKEVWSKWELRFKGKPLLTLLNKNTNSKLLNLALQFTSEHTDKDDITASTLPGFFDAHLEKFLNYPENIPVLFKFFKQSLKDEVTLKGGYVLSGTIPVHLWRLENVPHAELLDLIKEIVERFRKDGRFNKRRQIGYKYMGMKVNMLLTVLETIDKNGWNDAKIMELVKILEPLFKDSLKWQKENDPSSIVVQSQLKTITIRLIKGITKKLQNYNSILWKKLRKNNGKASELKYDQKVQDKLYGTSLKILQTFLPLLIEANTNSDGDFNFDYIVRNISFPIPKVIEYLYNTYKPFITKKSHDEKRKVAFNTLTKSYINSLHVVESSSHYNENYRKEATILKDKIFSECISQWSQNPMEALEENIKDILNSLNTQQRIKVYQLFKYPDILSLAADEDKLSTLETLLKDLPVSHYQEDLKKLLADDKKMSEVNKDKLKSYLDVSDHAIRKELTKAADSNSPQERMKAVTTLCNATLLSQDLPVQLKRTLTFIRQKIKNEQITYRIEATKNLIRYQTVRNSENTLDVDSPKLLTLFPPNLEKETLNIWLDMLQDALEVQDLDKTPNDENGEGGGNRISDEEKKNSNKHPLLKYYMDLSKMAIIEGAGNIENGYFELGFEIQWRIAKFRMGDKKVADDFRIEYPTELISIPRPASFPEGKESEFAEAHVKALETRVGTRNKKWREKVEFWKPLFSVLGYKWKIVPVIQEYLKQTLESIKENKKDNDGLYIIKGDHPSIIIFDYLLKMYKFDWTKTPIFFEYMETLLKTRQAKVVVFQWLKGREKDKRRKAQKQIRDDSVQKLLSITQSAIHLKFVWRHLMRWHPERLDKFIDPKKSFRGVFYTQEGSFKNPEFKQKSKRVGKHKVTRMRSFRVSKKVFPTFSMPSSAIKDINEKIAEEQKAEDKMIEEVKNRNLQDHEDFFFLQGCYGLHRFRPEQISNLRKQCEHRILNEERSTPSRVISCFRYTLMPITTYTDIVNFIAKHENEKASVGKKVEPLLNLNIQEALMKGVNLNDEPLAPLNYLLTMKFLSTDLARIAIYAISACIPYLEGDKFTDLLKLVLSGQRRENLKVTAYKEIIRLMGEYITSKHITMVNHEWNRKELHRDVRIAVIKVAFKFLKYDTEQSVKVAWGILLSVLEKTKEDWKHIAEIQTALLAGYPLTLRTRSKLPKTLFENPRISDHYEELNKNKIPEHYCEKFAKEVIIPLFKKGADSDVKSVAAFSLKNFFNFNISEESAQIYYYILEDTKEYSLNKNKIGEQKISNERYKQAVRDLFLVTAVSKQWEESSCKPADKSWIVKSITMMINKINGYESSERTKRMHAINNMDFLLTCIPYRKQHSYVLDEDIESFLKAIKTPDDFYWDFLIHFESNQTTYYNNREHKNLLTEGLFKNLYHDLFKNGESRPNVVSLVLECVSILSRNIVKELQLPVLKDLSTFNLAPDYKATDGYKTLAMVAILKTLGNADKSFLVSDGSLKFSLDLLDLLLDMLNKGKFIYYSPSIADDIISFVSHVTNWKENSWTSPEGGYGRENDKVLVSHLIKKLLSGNDTNSTDMVICKEYVISLLSSYPKLLLIADESVCPVLHWYIGYLANKSSYDNNAENVIIEIIKGIEKYRKAKNDKNSSTEQNSNVIALLNALITMNLKNTTLNIFSDKTNKKEKKLEPTNQTESYKRLSYQLSLKVLLSVPRYAIEQKEYFVGYVEQWNTICANESSQYFNATDYLSQIVSKCFEELKLEDPTNYIKNGKALLDSILSSRGNSHFKRTIVLNGLKTLGGLSAVKTEAGDYEWRKEFLDMLDAFCEDQDARIKKEAMAVDTTELVTSSVVKKSRDGWGDSNSWD